ncbi:MAG: tetratricopeptide repeat protein [Pseudomonadota bacterium]
MTAQPNIAALRYILERDPASPLFHDLATACFETGRLDEAERILRAGLNSHPEHLWAKVLLGRVLAKTGDLAGARAEFEAAAALLSEVSAMLLPELAVICEDTGDIERAVASLRLAAAHGPLAAGAHERLARLSARVGQRGRVAEREKQSAMGQVNGDQAIDMLRGFLGGSPSEAFVVVKLKDRGRDDGCGHEASQVIAVLQRWLQNIK